MIDWPAIGKRYGYGPDVVPERPWWFDPYAPVAEKPDYEYGEFRVVGGMGGGGGPGVEQSRYPRCPYVRSDGAVVYVDNNGDLDATLSAYDAEHPLPVPEPACGQVWRAADGLERLVRDVREPLAWWFSDLAPSEPLWPPPDSVLVSGPNAPWADTSKGTP